MSVQEDRRDVKSQRIPFEAIVEVGDVDPGAAFEAQGVNLSASGMQLRTAYLPEVGQGLLCRFGSGAQEIQTEADVVWTKHGARGGEFGIRFTNVDGASAAALWDLCGVDRDDQAEEGTDATRTEADEGTRVRLHIDGLTSPMKARVRGSVGKELLVGSNLEFLKVGRSLELENVDQGGKRPAHIDRVDVELDKESSVPQLVVTLRYDDMSADPPPVVPFPKSSPPYFPPSPSASAPPSPSSNAVELVADEPTIVRPAAPAPAPTVPSAVAPPAPAVLPAVKSSVDDRTPEEIELANMMRSKVSIIASDTMVKVAALGVRAKAALGVALSNAVQRSKERQGAEAPRRKTSPPPGGALHATGKRVVRDGADGADASREGDESRSKLSRKTMIAAGGATALVAVSVIAMMSRGGSAPPGAERSPEPAAAAPQPETNTAQASEAPPNASGPVEAKVPLFGPTMVATAESPAPAAPANPATSPINRTLAFGGTPNIGDEPSDRKLDADRKGDDKSGKARGKPSPFGNGKVEHAMVLRIKTDGTISDLHGVRSSGGFTLTMPGRRTLDSGSDLAARDSRIASVRVANNAKGSELTFHFKGGVPPYLVSPNGRDLQLSLGRPDARRDAKEPSHRSTTAQKRVEAPHRATKH
jgi:PilZ domain